MASIWNVTIDKGATFHRELTWEAPDPDTEVLTVVDLSGYTARWQARWRADPQAVIVSLTSGPGGGITLAATAPNIVLDLSAAQTRALEGQQGVHALELELAGVVDRLLEGTLTMTAEIVHD